jgi:hypothetical protein
MRRRAREQSLVERLLHRVEDVCFRLEAPKARSVACGCLQRELDVTQGLLGRPNIGDINRSILHAAA